MTEDASSTHVTGHLINRITCHPVRLLLLHPGSVGSSFKDSTFPAGDDGCQLVWRGVQSSKWKFPMTSQGIILIQ